jgi:hypothetical protein
MAVARVTKITAAFAKGFKEAVDGYESRRKNLARHHRFEVLSMKGKVEIPVYITGSRGAG